MTFHQFCKEEGIRPGTRRYDDAMRAWTACSISNETVKNARRYLWLRDEWWLGDASGKDIYLDGLDPKNLDAAIDAAMGQEKKGV